MSLVAEGQRTAAGHAVAEVPFVARIDRLVDALVEPVGFDVLVRLAMEATSGLGAIGAILVSLGPGEVVESVSTTGASRDMVSALGPLAVSEQVPILVAIRTREPQWVPSPAALQARFPEFAANVMRGQALASMPLLLDNDVALGGLGITFAEPRSFSDTERAFLLTVARIVTAALLRSAQGFASTQSVRYPGSALFDDLRDAVMVHDETVDKVVYANRAAESVLGCTVEHLLRMSGDDLRARIGGDVERLHGSDRLFAGQRAYVGAFTRFDGQQRRFEATISAANAVGHRAVVLVDVTDRVTPSEPAPSRPVVDDPERVERERSAHELHDRAIQAVFATSMSLAALSQAVPGHLADRVDALIDQLDELVAELNER